MTVNWYANNVKADVRDRSRKAKLKVAFQIEGQAKINITENGQVDTGFMRNTVYVTGSGQSNYGNAASSGEYTSAKQGDSVPREIAPEVNATGDDVYVVVGANYAIYQEGGNSFLYRALEQVAGSQAEVAIVESAR